MPSDPNKPATGEEALIAEYWAPLAAAYPGAFALKDDCAVIASPAGTELVVTTDALIEGVHFLPGEDASAIGWKALAVNVSDLVAKGAEPLAYLMSIALPAAPDHAWLRSFAAGLRSAQAAFGCHLAGGDTDRTPGPLTVSITAFGSVPSGTFVRRSAARAGDHVYVSGTIGDATLGLALAHDPGLSQRCNLERAACEALTGRFSRPSPPVGLVPALRACASASMDISDGLMKDLERMCRASSVGGLIEAARVPISPPARAVLAARGATLAELLTGGEDYEVLASVPVARTEDFERRAQRAGVHVTRIGSITGQIDDGVRALDQSGNPMIFTKTGWDHFQRRDAQ